MIRTNKERLDDLMQAKALIRGVEFSYPEDDWRRHRIYKTIVETFSFIGSLDVVIDSIKKDIKQEEKQND